MAAYSFVDVGIASYQAGYNVFESIGLAAVTASVAYAGATFGRELFTWGGAEAIASFGAGAFGGMSSGAAYAAMTGGNVGMGALSGLAAGATGGVFATGGNVFLSAAGSAIAGGAGSVVAGGSFGAGALEGSYGAAANIAMIAAIVSGQLQEGSDAYTNSSRSHRLIDNMKYSKNVSNGAKAGQVGRGKFILCNKEIGRTLEKHSTGHGIISKVVMVVAGIVTVTAAASGSVLIAAIGGIVFGAAFIKSQRNLMNLPDTAKDVSEKIYNDYLKEHLDEIDRIADDPYDL